MKLIAFPLFALASALSVTAPAQAQTFDGPSVGVQGGWMKNDLRNPETDLGIAVIDDTQDAAVLGGFLGYDRTIGNFVVGGEAGFNIGPSDSVSGTTAGITATIDSKWSFDLTARAGYLVTPRTLVYARGGYANDRIRTTLSSAAGTATASEHRDGWLLGAGIEHEIIPHVSTRLEYRYSDLSESDRRFDRHQTLVGVAYRF